MGAYDNFIQSILPYAKSIEQKYGIPTSVLIGQAINESSGGKYTPKDSKTGKESYNLFGVKGTGTAGSVQSISPEYENGTKVYKTSSFQAYNNYGESLEAYAKFLTGNDRYASALKKNDGYSVIQGIASSGYATNPNYAREVMNHMDYYNLTQYDNKSSISQPSTWIPNLLDQLYKVTSVFGKRVDPVTGKENVQHDGYDFAMPKGTAIGSTVSGKVLHAGSSTTGWGNYVSVQDSQGRTHIFAHLDSVSVKTGDSITYGSLVGKAGSTGKSTGNHLHYEVRENGKSIDPLAFLKPSWQSGGNSTSREEQQMIDRQAGLKGRILFTIPIPMTDGIDIWSGDLFSVLLFIIGAILIILTLYSLFLANNPISGIVQSVAKGAKA